MTSTKFWPVLLMVLHGFWGRCFFYSFGRPRAQLVNLFLSVICKDFLDLFGCLVLRCFLEGRLIYSSIIETKEVQRLIMKVGSISVCLLSCQFYYTFENGKHSALRQRKKLCLSKSISLLKLMRNISKHHFSGGGVLLNSIMDIHCSAEEGGADRYRMTVDVREWAVKSFHFE